MLQRSEKRMRQQRDEVKSYQIQGHNMQEHGKVTKWFCGSRTSCLGQIHLHRYVHGIVVIRTAVIRRSSRGLKGWTPAEYPIPQDLRMFAPHMRGAVRKCGSNQ